MGSMARNAAPGEFVAVVRREKRGRCQVLLINVSINMINLSATFRRQIEHQEHDSKCGPQQLSLEFSASTFCSDLSTSFS